MHGLHKSRRVSWASDSDIFQETKHETPATSKMGGPSHSDNFQRCTAGASRSTGGKVEEIPWLASQLKQVRLFLSKESPSQVGLSAHDLQAKTSLLLNSSRTGSDGILPPGFEGTHSSSQLQIKLSQIPVIRWTNPPKILLNLTWRVAVGEESKEIGDQSKREMRELEAIYPRSSSIPPNPSVSVDVEDPSYPDNQTELIPVTPMEDEDAAADVSSYDPIAPFDVSMVSQPLSLPSGIPKGSNSPASVHLPHDVQSDIAAASVALTHGNLIDHELLNKILNSPEVIEMLVKDYRTQGAPNSSSCPITFNQAEASAQSATFSARAQLVPHSSQSLPSSSASPVTPVEAPPTGDLNNYKSSFQQHGGERQGTLPYSGNCYIQQPMLNRETAHSSRSREQKPRIMKPCIYFNSSRGCRNGANCAFQHDAASQPQDSAAIPSSKRMKLNSEIGS